jgi:Flp pilus assembly pilin Flp
MKLFKGARAFKDDESGAVTVDWVVLTAAIVGLGIAIIATVKLASQDLADRIAASIDSIQPNCQNPHMHGSTLDCG